MSSGLFEISLSFNQIKSLVSQLSQQDKLRLSNELMKETKDQVLTRLLSVFETTDISEAEINLEVEQVRAELYANCIKNENDN